MSRQLMHSFSDFCAKTPTCIQKMCRAAMFRFARGELSSLSQLRAEVLELLGNSQSVLAHGCGRVPFGGIQRNPCSMGYSMLYNLRALLPLTRTLLPRALAMLGLLVLSFLSPPRTPLAGCRVRLTRFSRNSRSAQTCKGLSRKSLSSHLVMNMLTACN